MSIRAFAAWMCFGAVSLGSLLPGVVPARADEGSSSAIQVEPKIDLSQFPQLRGEVKHVIGHVASFVPPKAGEPWQLELRDVAKLTSLTFDPEQKSNIPLPGPVIVESVHHYSNGAFASMRLVSKQGRNSVTIDVIPRSGGGPKRVLVWVLVQSDVVQGVALIEGEFEGKFPDRAE